ncbi:IS30 family transposase [Bradyrhizobium sp. 145]|uniref:IS30 family transposase n=1 Tax=Bradyrhizobium sp. 145 TaxID=2782621 RepID=UPI001FF8EEE4|nr:IS30 family transposase [Bradyrhizobium sp. 145]
MDAGASAAAARQASSKAVVSLTERLVEATDRNVPGHWEADLMMFSKYRQAILAVHERTSRLLLAIPIESRLAAGLTTHLVRLFKAVPQALRRTVTFDNGSEFAAHLSLQSLLMKTFFCDPHAPWQKGGIENAFGRLRRFIPPQNRPRKSPDTPIAAYTNTPRKCLDFRTTAEAFSQLLHFECESTSPELVG